MIDPFHSYHVLVFNNDSVLLVKHGASASHFEGVYGIPGGRSKDHEIERETAIRELNEETGLIVNEKDLIELPVNTYSAYIKRKVGPSGNFTMKVFITDKFSGNLFINEETHPEWIKITELGKYNLLPNVKKAVLQAQKSFTRP